MKAEYFAPSVVLVLCGGDPFLNGEYSIHIGIVKIVQSKSYLALILLLWDGLVCFKYELDKLNFSLI